MIEKTTFIRTWDSWGIENPGLKQMYYFVIEVKGIDNLTTLYDEIIEWLKENCGNRWEAKWKEGIGFSEWFKIMVYFDMKWTEADRVAFKLRWL